MSGKKALFLLVAMLLAESLQAFSLIINLYTGPSIGYLVSAAVNPSNGYIYAVDSQHNDVVIFDPYNYSFIGTINVGVEPIYITYANGYFYVVNNKSGTISVINPQTNTLVKTIYVGGSPQSVVVDLKNGYLYVVDNGIEIFTQSGQEVATLLKGFTITSIVFDPYTGFVYVAGNNPFVVPNNIVSQINGTKILRNVSMFIYAPSQLVVGNNEVYGISTTSINVFNPYNISNYTTHSLSLILSFPCAVVYALGNIYAFSEGYEAVYVINVSNGQVSTLTPSAIYVGFSLSFSLPGQISDIVYDPKTNMLYVTGTPPNPIYVINPITGAYLAIGSQIQAQYAVYDNVTGDLYVANYQADSIYVLNNGKVIGIIPSINSPSLITYNTYNGVLYITNGGELVAENPYNGSILWKASAGKDAVALLYDPVDNLIYVADNSSNLVLAISPSNGSVISAIQVGNNPVALTYDPQNGLVYVANYNNESLSVINGTELITTIEVPFKPTAVAYGDGIILVGGEKVVSKPYSFPVILNYYLAGIEGVKTQFTIELNSTPELIAYYKGYAIITTSGLFNPVKLLVVNPSNGQIVSEKSVNVSFPTSVTIDPNEGLVYITEEYPYNQIYAISFNNLISTPPISSNTTTIPTTTTSSSTTFTYTSTSISSKTTTQIYSSTESAVPSSSSGSSSFLIIIAVIIVVIAGVIIALRRR
ncbi:YncE family protein [Sulfurisphaera tokodaii]|uniref:Uncharacterized protein n=2 Tax=Sulfurisphaera tokodaii TaxID=111955 RepID=Q96X88_SULTO|nr:PQQ-binding-like beta-propeller repeat protein [Sulfurisphaera tokodaii]BAB67740.1 hypothetical protein STK_26220 [Sulfurisphaera tokodaii str. 7]HII75259.1 PQQ-binding-like beta-propeller repeat protein [Sulfurisphaera tokodaii]